MAVFGRWSRQGAAAGLAIALAVSAALPAFVSLPALAQTVPEAAAPAYGGSYVKRVTLLVSDLDRSLAIYRDILGFQAGPVFHSRQGESYSYTVFNIDPAATLRGTMLSAGERQVRTLALFEVAGQPITVTQSPRPAALVIDAENLPEVMRRITALGLTTFPTRPLKTPEGVTGTEWGFVDPDGHLIVLYELETDAPAPQR
ncbi:MAG: hypothetical protein RLY86_4014 [Pseudomonadota bacterium]|jgi:catechol 2,3-dioxygenase-like lactoylglutathione lyase family enzyme